MLILYRPAFRRATTILRFFVSGVGFQRTNDRVSRVARIYDSLALPTELPSHTVLHRHSEHSELGVPGQPAFLLSKGGL